MKEGGEVDFVLKQLDEGRSEEDDDGKSGDKNASKKRGKNKKVKAQVLVAEGVWKNIDDSDDSSANSSDDDEEDEGDEDGNHDHDHILTVCRCLHLAAPVLHHPQPAVLLSPPPFGKKSEGVRISNGVAQMGAKAILKKLHLKHCGLVFISRGATAQTATVSSDMSNLRSRRNIGVDISEVFLLAGAQTVVTPLWSDEANALSTVIFTIKFYDDLVDCADEVRPVAVALKHTANWLKGATFAAIRNFIWASRVDRELLEEIDDELWSIALAQKMLKGQRNFKDTDDRWDRVQKNAQPFASPFYWATFRAVGSCGGIHDPRLAERDDFNEFEEDEYMESYLEEFDENDGKIEGRLMKGLKRAGREAATLSEAAGDRIAQTVADTGLADRAQGYRDLVLEKIETKKVAVAEVKEKVKRAANEAKRRKSKAADAIRNAPKMAAKKLESDAKARKRKRAIRLGEKLESPKAKHGSKDGGAGSKGKAKKRYEDDSDDEDANDYNTPEFSSVAELRRLRENRMKGVKDGGSKACSVM